MMAQVQTGLSKLTTQQAAIVLLAVLTLMAWGVATVRGGAPEPTNTTQQSDGGTYQKVVIRLQAGEQYYEALGAELRAGGYPTKSVFNWRTPLHLTAVAALGEAASRYLLVILADAAVFLAGIATRRGGWLGPVQSFVMLLALSECFIFNASFHLIAEVWVGVFIIISVAAYALGWWPVGVSAGTLALFVRESALPYVVVSG